MASIQRCWPSEHASVSSSRLSSLQFRNLPRFRQVHCRRIQKGLQVSSSIQEEFPTTTEKLKVKNRDLNLPLQPKETHTSKDFSATMNTLANVSPEEAKQALKAAKEKFGRETVTKALQEAKKKLGKQGLGKLALYGGAATVGALLSGALLTSLEVLPLFPEAMQTVGLAYSVLVASRMMGGKPTNLTMSPVRAVIEIVDGGKVQVTSIVMPADMDEGTVAAMERLARERDIAVNQVQEMKRQTARYSEILAQKDALETVALQLAEERETAVSEVNALKSAVESMTDRMKGIEEMLEREVSQLKSQNQALETVALQLAQERNLAIEETVNLKARSEAEKQALEEVAAQLAQERDAALSEIASLIKIVANVGLSPSESTPMLNISSLNPE